jgi:cytochrome c-type protein NapB
VTVTPSAARTWLRVLAIAGGAALMVVLVIWLGQLVAGRAPAIEHPPALPMAAPDPPIAAEAGVFATDPSELAVPAEAERRAAAHPRTLAMYRSVRAYPGAPPRIPHGLTEEEFRSGSCGGCHERGGYTARFRLYAPVTPHPEMGSCLQCHAVDEELVGLALPATADETCLQCHRLDGTRPAFRSTTWRAPEWPALGQRAMEGSPPWIPHDLEMRGNCLACHAGPAAVAELRTTHPERANCRQCHVPVPATEGVFTRPLDSARLDSARPGGGA